jgi:hypothetical protein
MSQTTDQASEPSKIRFQLSCQEADLSRLALAALSVYQAQRFALRHGLALDEVRPQGDVREFALLVNARQLEEVLLGLRLEGVLFGLVECGDPAALAICQELGLPGKLGVPSSGPAASAEEEAT